LKLLYHRQKIFAANQNSFGFNVLRFGQAVAARERSKPDASARKWA
jgi:hypothetical protein